MGSPDRFWFWLASVGFPQHTILLLVVHPCMCCFSSPNPLFPEKGQEKMAIKECHHHHHQHYREADKAPGIVSVRSKVCGKNYFHPCEPFRWFQFVGRLPGLPIREVDSKRVLLQSSFDAHKVRYKRKPRERNGKVAHGGMMHDAR